MLRPWWFMSRPLETTLLALVVLLGWLGFVLATAAAYFQQGQNPLPALPSALIAPTVLAVALFLLHMLLQWRRVENEQLLLPITGLLIAVGLTMIWRLRPPEAVWQQLLRGFIPGAILMAILILRPHLVERVRRDWPITISLVGLGLLVMTAFFGVVDESGARLSLKLGPLPAVQTSELIKLA
ncbi:MAG TPA: hypothetical protein VEC96_01160, partial [Anaerolineae bacterium]|nr:hypothetical protein [Anaerolineae bacterium]